MIYDVGQPETAKHDTVIRVDNVSKAYELGKRKIQVLSDFNLNVHSQDFIIIYGPSGCGKSTLLNIMIGAEEITSGRVVVRGQNIFSLPEDERGVFRCKKIGVVYQMPYWVKSLNTLQNVALPLIIEGVTEKKAKVKAAELLEKLKVSDLAYQKPTQLSGGEQQKIAFARALVSDPHIIVADEPTGNLDTSSSDEIMSIFHDLNVEMKKTIILVTHNQAYWSLGTRRIEMRDGQIINEVVHG
jgi:putative ABC transport system ATP-binding protein